MKLLIHFVLIEALKGQIPYPINFHGHNGNTEIHCFDTDPSGNLVFGGETQDQLMTDNTSSWRRGFLAYQKYSDASWLWSKYYSRDPALTPKQERRRTSVVKFTKEPIVGQGNAYMIVAGYTPINEMDKLELDFIIPTPTFNLLGSYQVVHAIHGANFLNKRFNMASLFVRTYSNSGNTAQVIEVYIISYQAYDQNPALTQGKQLQFERIEFTVPTGGGAPTISSTYFNGGPDGTVNMKYFTANSIMVKNNMIYAGITYEYDLPDGSANNFQGYGIWRTNIELDNAFNRIDGNTCKENIMGFTEEPFCARYSTIVRIIAMDYFDRFTAFSSHSPTNSQEDDRSTSWHDFIMQCNGIGSTDPSQFIGDTFKTWTMHTGILSLKRFVGMYHKDAQNVFGLFQDTQYEKVYFVHVTINSITDCNTFDITIKNRQMTDFSGTAEKINILHAQFFNYPGGLNYQEIGISGFSTKNDWCNNGYSPNAPNNSKFGFIAAVAYRCGAWFTITIIESQTMHEHYFNKFDVAGKQIGNPVDVKSNALNGLKDMTLNVGTTVTTSFTGCKFCCATIRNPGSQVLAGRYPDKTFYATASTNFNVFSTDIREFLTFTDELNCPTTSCQINKGNLCDQSFVSASSNLNPLISGTGMGSQVQMTHNPSLLSAGLTLPASDDICIHCSHTQDYGHTEQFKLTLDCGTISGPINGESLTNHDQQYFVQDVDSLIEPEFIFKQFTNSISNCPVESYCVSSTNTDPCTLNNKLSSLTQNFINGPSEYGIKMKSYLAPDQTTFYIKVTAKSNNGPRYIYTTAMTMTLVCGPLSTKILDSSILFDKFQLSDPSGEAKFIFYESSPSNINCPIITYELTQSPTTVVAPTNGLINYLYRETISISQGVQANAYYVKPIDPTIDGIEYKFYIKISALGGAEKWSPEYTLKVDAMCSQKELGFNNSQRNVVLVQNQTTHNRPYVLNVAEMFFTGDKKYCPILGYEIWNVYDGTKWLKTIDGGKPWEEKLQFDEQTGVLGFFNSTELVDQWQIYIVARNKAKISTTAQWPVSLSIIKEVNFKPRFIDFESSLTINVAEFLEGSRQRFTYQIPKSFDPNYGNQVTITVPIKKQMKFMKVDYQTMSIYFDNLSLFDVGTYEIPFLLQDDDKSMPSKSDEYILEVKIECKNTKVFKDCEGKNQITSSDQNSRINYLNIEEPFINKLWANITSLSDTGLMTIKFRDFMQTKKFGEFDQKQLAKYFNNDTFSIYVIRVNSKFMEDPYDDPDIKYYNLSFYCVKYFEDEMQVQIDFEHPLWVSQNVDRDILHVNIINYTYFRSNYTRSPNWLNSKPTRNMFRNLQERPELNFSKEFQENFKIDDMDSLFDEQGREYEFTLSLNYTNLRVRIPKIVPEKYKTYIETNETYKKLAYLTILLVFITGFLFYRICWILLLGALMSIQVVAHLPLLKVALPVNALIAFKDILPIASFDWLVLDYERTRWFTRSIFKFDDFSHSKFTESIFFSQPRDLGWDSHCFLLIMGSFFPLWVLYFFKMLLLGIFQLILTQIEENNQVSKRNLKRLEFQFNRAYRGVFWSNFILLFLISLYEILIGGVLNSKVALQSSIGDIFSSIFTIIIFILITLIVVPKFLIQILSKDLSSFQKDKVSRLAATEKDQWFQQKFGTFWWRQPIQNKCQIAYSVAFILRRVFYVIIIFSIEEFWTQMFATFILNYSVSLYYGSYKPKKLKLEYRMELFNEIMIYCTTYQILLLSNWVPDPEVRFFYGWTISSTLMFMLFVNLLVIAYFLVKCSIIFIKKIVQWVQIMRYLLNIKYNFYRNKSQEQESNQSIFHQNLIKFLFDIKFFKKENKYEYVLQNKEEQIKAIYWSIKEIKKIRIGFAVSYPYEQTNLLGPAKSILHQKIRKGYAPYLNQSSESDDSSESSSSEEQEEVKEETKQEIIQEQVVEPKSEPMMEIEQANEVKKPTFVSQILSLFDYNKLLNIEKPVKHKQSCTNDSYDDKRLQKVIKKKVENQIAELIIDSKPLQIIEEDDEVVSSNDQEQQSRESEQGKMNQQEIDYKAMSQEKIALGGQVDHFEKMKNLDQDQQAHFVKEQNQVEKLDKVDNINKEVKVIQQEKLQALKQDLCKEKQGHKQEEVKQKFDNFDRKKIQDKYKKVMMEFKQEIDLMSKHLENPANEKLEKQKQQEIQKKKEQNNDESQITLYQRISLPRLANLVGRKQTITFSPKNSQQAEQETENQKTLMVDEVEAQIDTQNEEKEESKYPKSKSLFDKPLRLKFEKMIWQFDQNSQNSYDSEKPQEVVFERETPKFKKKQFFTQDKRIKPLVFQETAKSVLESCHSKDMESESEIRVQYDSPLPFNDK